MTLTNAQIDWALSRNGGEPGIWLATLYSLETGDLLRLARNTEDIVSRTLTFTRSYFEVLPPSDNDDQPLTSITFPNPDYLVGHAILQSSGPLTVTLERVLPSDPDVVVENHRMLRLQTASIDELSVEFRLVPARLDQEPYGRNRVTPSWFLGLWKL